ncbi:hypothetical protein [Streptomyces lydicus]|uniref:hypothetical protein n=1 Tax=Streptomyces lydicus TaxID=47763 RepID=UPI0010105C86|nr:hypothetical protein [Streptomyces lydicus]MCZ1012635.1 hypothetical protein [Streptomyces lydicus]
MEDTRQLAELARCIDEHNSMSRRARELFARTQETSQKIGDLVNAALRTGTSWKDLNRLLATVEDAPPPGALASNHSPEQAPSPSGVVIPAQARNTSAPLPRERTEQEGVPSLLVRAYAVVSTTPEREMASRDLAAALGHNVNAIGGDLCALLREVGVVRPNKGKINARYEKLSNRLPGFTADCLKQAIDAYSARTAPVLPATGT